MIATTSENKPFIEVWNTILTPKWLRFRHLLSANGQRHSRAAEPHVEIARGERILDVGSGFGETSVQLGRRVGAAGSVLGIDCGAEFVRVAEHERRQAEVDNVGYLVGDIQTEDLTAHGPFDVAHARFALMYCLSPVGALRNIRRALRPGGRVYAFVWQPLARNPAWREAEAVALRHLPEPGEGGKACGPGPFSMGDPASNREIVAAAGLEVVEQVSLNIPICIGRTIDEAIAFQMLVGPAGYLIREAGALGVERVPAIERELRSLFHDHLREDGSVWMRSSSWLISARRA